MKRQMVSDLTFRYEKNIYPILLSEERMSVMNIYIYIIRWEIKVHESEVDSAVIHLYTTITVKRLFSVRDFSRKRASIGLQIDYRTIDRKWTIR